MRIWHHVPPLVCSSVPLWRDNLCQTAPPIINNQRSVYEIRNIFTKIILFFEIINIPQHPCLYFYTNINIFQQTIADVQGHAMACPHICEMSIMGIRTCHGMSLQLDIQNMVRCICASDHKSYGDGLWWLSDHEFLAVSDVDTGLEGCHGFVGGDA